MVNDTAQVIFTMVMQNAARALFPRTGADYIIATQ